MQFIIDLTKEQARIAKKIEDAIDDGDEKKAKALEGVSKAILNQKNTLNEFRHAQKFLANEEGRHMAEKAKLESQL